MIVDKDNITITTSTGATRSYLDDSIDALTYWVNDFSQSLQNINIPNFDTYIKGIWHVDDTDTKGNEENMENKILDLYYRRTREKICKEYDEKIKKEYEELPVVKEYNEVVKTFEATLAEMADRYNTEDIKMLRKSGYSPEYTYELCINETIGTKLEENRQNELKELELFKQEVEAQLSLSNDKDYQIEVLKTYGILDKKTGKLSV